MHRSHILLSILYTAQCYHILRKLCVAVVARMLFTRKLEAGNKRESLTSAVAGFTFYVPIGPTYSASSPGCSKGATTGTAAPPE